MLLIEGVTQTRTTKKFFKQRIGIAGNKKGLLEWQCKPQILILTALMLHD